MSKILEKIQSEVDHEPTGGYVLARVIRLERALEFASGKSLDDMQPPPPAPPAPAPLSPDAALAQQLRPQPAAAPAAAVTPAPAATTTPPTNAS